MRGSLVAILCAAGLMSGCAVNDHVLVGSVRHWASGNGYAIEIDAYGAHAMTDVDEAGLTLGHSHRVVFFHNPCAPTRAFDPARVEEDLKSAGFGPVCRAKWKSWKDLGEPLAVSSRAEGVELSTNRRRVGVTLGVHATTALVLDAREPVLMYAHISSGRPEENKLVFWGPQECTGK